MAHDVKVPLIVVRDASRRPRYVCRICHMRGERSVFYDGEETAYERHVVACANRHEDELRSRSARVISPALFDPDQSGDVEFGRWIFDNREALIEGRLKLK